MNKYGVIIIALIVGLVIMFGLLILMYLESEKEKRLLIAHYETKIKGTKTMKSSKNGAGSKLQDSLFKK